MTQRDDDSELEAFFAAARARPPEPTEDLLARVLAAAEAEQARRARSRSGSRAGSWAGPCARAGLGGLFDALGGWGGIGGLVAAGLTGVWIGVTGTGALGTASGAFWGADATLEAGLDPGELMSFALVLEEDA